MIRYFNKLRYQHAADNKVAKYLRYAIGEILLVVIGILIALQINNRNSYQKDRKMENHYYVNFLEEMRADSSFIHGYWAWAYPQKIAGLQLARQYVLYHVEVTDTADFIDKIGKGGLLSRSSLFENTGAYDDIISTGNLRLIRNKNIRSQILYYYTLIDNTIKYIDNLRTDYSTFTNSMVPYDPKRSFVPEAKDYKRALEHMKSDEFLSLANNELTFGYSLQSRLGNVDQALMKVMDSIKSELKKKK